MNAEMDIGTNKKAFQITLDKKKYGTSPELGPRPQGDRRRSLSAGAPRPRRASERRPPATGPRRGLSTPPADGRGAPSDT